MKKYFITIVLLLLLIGAKSSEAITPKFFITMEAYDDKGGLRAGAVIQALYMSVSGRLKKEYPCVEYLDIDVLGAVLNWESMSARLGSGDEERLKSIGAGIGCQYLIVLKVKILNNKALISALCADKKKEKVLSRAFETVPYGDAAIDAVDKVANTLFDGLKSYEICPFKGPVKVEITSKLDSSQTIEYPVYCNKSDGMFHKVSKIFKNTDNNWTIERTGKGPATGNIKFTLSEVTSVEEKNDCYECSPQKQGIRTYYKKIIHRADVQGLSKESESYGIKVDDARVELTFLDNGTYTIRIKASSKQGDMKIRTEEKAEGICDNINIKPDIKEKKADVGIKEIFGPFTGTAQDKVLSQKNTIKRINPENEEEETITYEFNLTRD